MQIKNITFDEQFWNDWIRAEESAKDSLTRKIGTIADYHILPRSLNAHKVKNIEVMRDVWIGYVNCGGHAYRILFTVDKDKVMNVMRLMTHDDIEKYLKSLQ